MSPAYDVLERLSTTLESTVGATVPTGVVLDLDDARLLLVLARGEHLTCGGCGRCVVEDAQACSHGGTLCSGCAPQACRECRADARDDHNTTGPAAAGGWS